MFPHCHPFTDFQRFALFFQTFFLLHEEGFFVGASSGLNVAAAVKVRNECTKLIQHEEV